jgi:hypothetical protein
LPPAGIGLCCRESAGGAVNRPISAGHCCPDSVRKKKNKKTKKNKKKTKKNKKKRQKKRERERERDVFLIGLCCDSSLPGDF